MLFIMVQLLHSGNEEDRNMDMDMVAGKNVRFFQFTMLASDENGY